MSASAVTRQSNAANRSCHRALAKPRNQRPPLGDRVFDGRKLKRRLVARLIGPDFGHPNGVSIGGITRHDVAEAAGHVSVAGQQNCAQFFAFAVSRFDLADQSVHRAFLASFGQLRLDAADQRRCGKYPQELATLHMALPEDIERNILPAYLGHPLEPRARAPNHAVLDLGNPPPVAASPKPRRNHATGQEVVLGRVRVAPGVWPQVHRDEICPHRGSLAFDRDVLTAQEMLRAREAGHAFSMALRNRGGSDQHRAVRPDDPRIRHEKPLQLRDLEVALVERAKVTIQDLLTFENLRPVHRILLISSFHLVLPLETAWTQKYCGDSQSAFIQVLSMRARRIQAITAESTSLTLARPTRRRIVS